MAVRRLDGVALLVAGFGGPGAPSADPSAVHTLGQIGEALLATGAAWQIRRLTAAAGERYAADRATLKRQLDDLAAEPVRAAIIVLLGAIVDVGDAPALVTGAQPREYPEDATLPLAWIRERLIAAKADQLVVVVSARGGTASRWLEALGTHRTQHVIAADAPEDGNPAADALLTGLCGDALDPRTGTVTMASLSEHLSLQVPLAVMQGSTASETIAQPPPFAGLWDVRRSQLANRPHRPRTGSDLDDLTGTVLPGRFRLDRVLARGTFGSVYRARQLAVERDIAVKVLHADIDPSSEDGRLFVHEIRSVGQLDHTNIVRIHQADITHDGRLFFAMELLDGRDLQQLGTEGRLPRDRAVELVRQLLAGLGAAHDAGLVHADVKPANAIVVPRVRKPANGDSGRIAAGARMPSSALTRTPSGAIPTVDPEAPRSSRSSRSSRPPSDAMIATLPASATAALPAVRPPSGALAVVRPPSGAMAAVTAEDDAGERLVLVDFGLARLRAPDRPTESAGGTPAYMAPEQLHEGRVDARSDLYSATLVLVFLLTGWRRPNIHMLSPSLDTIPDPDLRAVLARALDPDPARRFQTARELLSALTGNGGGTPVLPPSTPVLPFRHLASLTEADRGRLHGREADLALLTEHVLFRRSVVYTAPSGTGKTSLLRAGLVPRLEALGVRAIYQRCRGKPVRALSELIAPESASIAEAVESWHRQQDGGKLVLVLDQLEASFADPEFLPSVLGFDRWPPGADVAVVLSIREDYLARLVARTQEIEPGMPIVRLPPLGPAGARAAILAPLTEARLAIEPELLDALLEDLQRAAAAIGPEMGWGGAPAVYPPHLQLACTVLYEHLDPGEATLTLAHYRRLGGFDAIVGEHLERVLDTDLADGRDVIARDLFVALVTTAQERAIRPEAELVAIVGAKHGATQVAAVLEILRSRGLLVRVRGNDEPCWELVHDSLIPRVLAWIDARDLARRRAIELVRYHLRRSHPDEPSLLDRAELRELKAHDGAIAELDEEWKQRGADDAWTPGRLVERSRQVLRRRRAILATTVVAALALGSTGMYRSCVEQQRAEDERLMRARDMGLAELSIEGFDLDDQRNQIPVPPGADWSWEIHAPKNKAEYDLGAPLGPEVLVRGERRFDGRAAVESLEVRGKLAYLVVTRGTACAQSIVPLELEGYEKRATPQQISVLVPTCAASRVGMEQVPGGPFIYGGLGDPPAPNMYANSKIPPERDETIPTYYIDATEVTNEMFELLVAMPFTGIKPRVIDRSSSALQHAHERRKPVTHISWFEARAFCRYLGKDLPTKHQWGKALRGGKTLRDGSVNPRPKLNLPWGEMRRPVPARIASREGAADVATHPADRSLYGVYDLVGNVFEWTRDEARQGTRVVRGADWLLTTEADLLDFLSVDNERPEHTQEEQLGMRCVSER